MFDHIVKFSDANRKLAIYRRYENGREELFTSIEIPLITLKSDRDKFEDFAKQLGENIIIDSPSARNLFEI
jgi:hypothetical protein